MSKRFSPAAIGAFVVGAVTLAVIAVLLFGSGRLFRKTYPFILHFSGDVSGLNVGAPVKFKGVEIGSVTEVMLSMSDVITLEGAGELRIPVLIEVDASRLTEKGAKLVPVGRNLERLIERGMRGQLAMQSFVTGLLYVKIDLFPGTPVNLVNDPTSGYPEIPTLPTPLEQVQARLGEFLAKLDQADVAGMVASLRSAVTGLDRVLNSADLKTSLEALPGAVEGIKSASGDVKTALASVRKLADDLGSQVRPLGGSLREASDSARETLHAATLTVQQLQALMKPDAPLLYSLDRSLNDLSTAARAIRRVAEELERDPSMLVRGKASGEEPK